jgi:hypothetical protein
VNTNLDALLTALYVYLDDHVLPSREQPAKRGPARLLTDAELAAGAEAWANYPAPFGEWHEEPCDDTDVPDSHADSSNAPNRHPDD